MADKKGPAPTHIRARDLINPNDTLDEYVGFYDPKVQQKVQKDVNNGIDTIYTTIKDHLLSMGKDEDGKPSFGSHAHIKDKDERYSKTRKLLHDVALNTTYKAEVGKKTVDKMLELYDLVQKKKATKEQINELVNHEKNLEEHVANVFGSYLVGQKKLDKSQVTYDNVIALFSGVDFYDAFTNEKSPDKKLREHLQAHITSRHSKVKAHNDAEARIKADLRHYKALQGRLNKIVARDGVEVKEDLGFEDYLHELEALVTNPNYRPVAGDIYKPLEKKKK